MTLSNDIITDILENLFTIARDYPAGGDLIDPQLINHDREHYQRDMDHALVKEHRKTINRPWCGIVAKREDGSYWSINGQHHTQAAIDEDVRRVNYMVIQSSGWEYEAKLFKAFSHWQSKVKVDKAD